MTNSNKSNIADAIRISSVSLLVPIIDKYPIMKDLLNSSKSDKPAEEWDYFMTAAGCGLVLMSSEDHEGEHEEVKNRLVEMDKTFPQAIDDFTEFMNKSEASDDLIAATVGLWVLWNIKKEQPSDDETSQLAPILGQSLIKVISDWRNSK